MFRSYNMRTKCNTSWRLHKLYPAKLVTKLLASDGGATASTNGGVAASSNGSAAASSDGEDGQGVEIDPSEVMEQY